MHHRAFSYPSQGNYLLVRQLHGTASEHFPVVKSEKARAQVQYYRERETRCWTEYIADLLVEELIGEPRVK